MIENIKNIEKLAEAFGRKKPPSFHDAEIISICLNRSENIFLDVKLFISSFIKNIEKKGKVFNNYLNVHANFRFKQVSLEHLENFNHQNVINDLYIFNKADSDDFFVRFESIYGCDLKFECKEIELLDFEIFETEKERFQPDFEQLRLAKQAWKKFQSESGK